MRTFLSLLVAFLAIAPSIGLTDPRGLPAGSIAEYHLMVPMRDGVRLATDSYRPAKTGSFPTLFVRDIYSNGSNALRQRYARWALENGYAFVFQSTRGRYDSEGTWNPYFQEVDDGHDTLTWIQNQPWSNGKVGMFGASYLASVQWLAALGQHPALRAIAPAMSPGNYYRDVAYPGGAFSLLSRASWGLGLVGSRTNQTYPIDWVSAVTHLPLKDLGRSLGLRAQHFDDWLAHPTYDDYWKPLNLEKRAPEMGVPALNIGGWYDVFLRSTLGSFTTMQEEAATLRARENQRLVIGPWVHGWNKRKAGELDFGPNAEIDEEALQAAWFDHWLKDEPAPKDAKVRIFVMGENAWRDEEQWPLARAQSTPFYLAEGGLIRLEAPTEEKASQAYRYDPLDPVPTLGGNIMRPELRGPFDQAPLDDRKDILRFQSEPFKTRMEITGPISAVLYVSSSAVDTDFMAKLIVVKEDGRAFNLVDGVVRTRFRNGYERESLMAPGEVIRLELDLWATSYAFAPGERLRVDITSSNFPRLARNLNTGAPFAEGESAVVAEQTLYFDRARPSHLLLPIIPNEAP